MSENNTKEKSFFNSMKSSSATKMGEIVITHIWEQAVAYYKQFHGEMSIETGRAFTFYLENAYDRLNCIKTLVTGFDKLNIIGVGSIYVDMDVTYSIPKTGVDKDIYVTSVEELLEIGNNILITGTGGAGKTMLMKYLFLNTVNRNTASKIEGTRNGYIPVYIELRRVKNQKTEIISIGELIYESMKVYGVDLPFSHFEYSLKYGGYLFLLDGFDEVSDDYVYKTAHAIQEFSTRYSKNLYIITSRERDSFSLFETFSVVRTKPLNLNQVLNLVYKLGEDTEKNKAFCEKMENEYYNKYKTFAENPLLLTIMFVEYMRNGSIPNYLPDFFGKCFEALYSQHDSNQKGDYERAFKSDLCEFEFKQLFARFCFITFFLGKSEFKKSEIINYLDMCIRKGNYKKNITAERFLDDLMNSVCLIVKDGEYYQFVHTSFQTYFAAMYINDNLNDAKQKKFIEDIFKTQKYSSSNMDFYRLLYQINKNRFSDNVIEPVFLELKSKLQDNNFSLIDFVKIFFREIIFFKDNKCTLVNCDNKYGIIIDIFLNLIIEDLGLEIINAHDNMTILLDNQDFSKLHYAVFEVVHQGEKVVDRCSLKFEDIDNYLCSNTIGAIEYYLINKYYDQVMYYFKISKIKIEINDWLEQQEDKHKEDMYMKSLEELVTSCM